MTTRVIFATPNQARQDDLRRLLADIEVVLSRFGPPVPPGLDLEATARWRARAAHAALGARCFVENTAVELEGEPAMRGAMVKELLEDIGDDGVCARHGGRAITTRVVVALADGPDDADITLFTGALDGAIATAPRGTGGRGWDRVVIPDGFHRTLAELGDATYLVNMRHGPYLDLADHLRGRTFGGAFEAHVTVRCAAEDGPRFAALCDQLGVKHIAIELASGEVTTQPMTASVHRGELRAVQDQVHDLARAILAGGFEVVRSKIEALPRNRDIPETDAAAGAEPGRYFEYHLKLVIPAAVDLAQIAAAAAAHGGWMSRNARRQRTDGGHERYVTLRLPGLGRASADARFAALEAAMAAQPVAITRRVREYTVYDSNVALDRGWR
jgi:inosine/xanthosine triphosphate pyrophosphatase family protein